jgi:KDO2-lipid IV(A) lauroyltransferase
MNSYATYRLACVLSKRLPQRLSYALAVRVADGFYRRDRTGREAVRANLRVVLSACGRRPDENTLAHMARQTFRYFGKYLVDFFRYSRITDAEARRLLRIEHPEHLEAAMALGRGVLTVSAHIGNWELGGVAMRMFGRRLNAVVLPQRLEKLNRLFQKHREERGIHVLPLGRAMHSILACLKRNELVALLADKDFSARGRRVEFFGRLARLPRGPAFLAVKTGAPLLPGVIVRQEDDSFVLRYYPPLLAGNGDSVDGLQAQVCRVLEAMIGELPCQWFMFTPLWDANGPEALRAEAGPAASGAGE